MTGQVTLEPYLGFAKAILSERSDEVKRVPAPPGRRKSGRAEASLFAQRPYRRASA
jgi:hypothetical protein